MVINREISILNDIDFKVLVHLFVGNGRKPCFSTEQGGLFSFSADEITPICLVRDNPWDDKNLLHITLLAVISSLYLPWGGIMEASFAPFSCHSVIHFNTGSSGETIFSLKENLQTNKRALKIWHIVAISQFVFLDLFLFGIIIAISFLLSPWFSWIARFIGLVLFITLAVQMNKRTKTVFSNFSQFLMNTPK